MAAEPSTDSSEADAARSASQASRLISLADEVEFFHTPDEVAYGRIDLHGHKEVWPLGSRAFRTWLAGAYYRKFRKAAGRAALGDALNVLVSRALFDGETHEVHVRVARYGDEIFLDLADPAWRTIRIAANGWKLETDPPVRFRRPKGLLSLPVPVRGGSVDQLRKFFNVRDDDQWRLLVACLVAAFRPSGPYPILAFNGEQGSGKSSAARVFRALVDPNKSATRAAPRDERDLAIAATNGAIVSLDNLSAIPDWLSDALCRVSTGLGFATRTLYENDEETLFEIARPIVINGIGSLGTRSDLLDRTIELELPTIAPGRRRDEDSFWSTFERERPAIIGALLDAVAGALRDHRDVQLAELPRMADFARWAIAAEPYLGWPTGSFMTSFGTNRDSIHELALEASPIVPPLLELIEAGPFLGTSTELLDRLVGLAGEPASLRRGWPGNAKVLSVAIARIAPNLRQIGIEVDKRRSGRGRRLIGIRAVAPASPASPAGSGPRDGGDGSDAPSLDLPIEPPADEQTTWTA